MKNKTPSILSNVLLLEISKEQSSLTKIKQYVDAGVDINYQSEEDGYTPLMLAVENNDQSLVSYLLEQGADPLIKNQYQEIASFLALTYSPIYQLLKNHEVVYGARYNDAVSVNDGTNMFDFSKIGMKPTYTTGFEPAATDEQIAELEQHCGHILPENYKVILKNYNGGRPEATYFNATDEDTGIPLEWELTKFYHLNNDKIAPADIWWLIENYSEYMGPNTLPFADDGLQQIYYMKWVNDVPQVWFLAYLDLEEPETYFVMNSFDELLGALYNADPLCQRQ